MGLLRAIKAVFTVVDVTCDALEETANGLHKAAQEFNNTVDTWAQVNEMTRQEQTATLPSLPRRR